MRIMFILNEKLLYRRLKQCKGMSDNFFGFIVQVLWEEDTAAQVHVIRSLFRLLKLT